MYLKLFGLPEIVGYEVVKAGCIFGIVTADAGRVRNRVCYRLNMHHVYAVLPNREGILYIHDPDVDKVGLELLRVRRIWREVLARKCGLRPEPT